MRFRINNLRSWLRTHQQTQEVYRSQAHPIIVGGSGRHGTTLLREILAEHSQLCCGPESRLFIRRYPFQHDQAYFEELAIKFDLPLDTVQEMRNTSDSHAEFIDRFFTAFCSARGKARWVETTPTNVRHLGYIFRHFPNATLIHVIQDEQDVIQTLCAHPKYTEGKHDHDKANPKRFQSRAARWNKDVALGRVFQSDPRYYEVRYEDLVHRPRRTLERLLRFLDLPPEEQTGREYP